MTMTMKKTVLGDIVWAILLLVWVLVLVVPEAREMLIKITDSYPYISGFVKFFFLATMGDLLGMRIFNKKWSFPQGMFFKAVLWGILGMGITLVFTVFMAGAGSAQAAGRLPFNGVKIAQAFFGSVLMNTTWGPMLYVYHKFGDLFIDVLYERKNGLRTGKVTVRELVDKVDWHSLTSFSWLITCPLVWIPCHTIVFMLPNEYRVITSAFLSILLGVLVALTKKKNMQKSKAA